LGAKGIYGHDIVVIDLYDIVVIDLPETEGIFLILYNFLSDTKRCNKHDNYCGFLNLLVLLNMLCL